MSNEENYLVLARKYRPKKLADIIGQEEICSVIEGSIKLNRVAHAFLFSGTRGVGKTTLARILAKILNCTELKENKIEACEKCSNCISIENESNMDVIEIDAASKTGVSDVREIIENVNYKAVNAKKKVFIIDEVHMLSKAAFNALLKTLEEPPPDVVFIFATTETEKVPVTILSRCQRFSLRRIGFDLISKHLIKIAKLENLKLDDEPSKLIAQCSEGSVRDALSILENVIAKNNTPDINIVREVLGLTDFSSIMDLFKNLFKGDVDSSLTQFDKLYEQGVSIDELAKSLMNLSYNLALIKSGIKSKTQYISEPIIKQLDEFTDTYEMDFIIRFWELMQKYMNELSDVFDEKQCFEMIIMRLCYASLVPTPFEVLNQKKDEKDLIIKKIELSDRNHIDSRENIKSNKIENDSNFSTDNLAREQNEILQSKEIRPKGELELEKFSKLVNLIEKKSEMVVAYHLKHSFRLVSFNEPKKDNSAGNIELENIENNSEAEKTLWKASKILETITKKRWILSISNKNGSKTLSELEKEKNQELIDSLKKEEIIKKILEIIPSSEVISISKILK